MIIRAEKKGNFTVLPNSFLLDETISDKARGLLGRLLCRPDNWKLNVNHLVKTGKAGQTAVRSAIQELIAARYIENNVRRLANGQIIGVEYIIRDTPAEPSGDRPAQPVAHACNDTATGEVQAELFDEGTMAAQEAPHTELSGEIRNEALGHNSVGFRSSTQPTGNSDALKYDQGRNRDTGKKDNQIKETQNKEIAPVINTDIKQILKETTTTPKPVIPDPDMPLSSSSNLEILNLIPEKHRSPMVVTFVNKAIVDYPQKEVEQALGYAAGNVRGGSMQFRAYLDKTLRNNWADGWEPEDDEKQKERRETEALFKRLPDSQIKMLAEGGNVVAVEELKRRESAVSGNVVACKPQCARA